MQTFIFHFNVQKLVEEFLTGPQSITILVIGFKEIGVVSIGTLSIFEKVNFPFYVSYCHENIATYEYF